MNDQHNNIFKKQPRNNKTVTVVGAGISGLMTAFVLHQAGYRVSVYAKGPDPRKDHDAEQYSSTGNGRMARHITRFEGQPYIEDTPMYPNMKKIFQSYITDGGWLGKRPEEYSHDEKEWLQKRYAACDNAQHLKRLNKFYIDANKYSLDMWYVLTQDFPFLFEDADLYAKGDVRFYGTHELYEYAKKIHVDVNALIKEMSPQDIKQSMPAFQKAFDVGNIHGGLHVQGMTFNILAFVDNLIDYLEHEGVGFTWNTEITSIEQRGGVVSGLHTRNNLITADHYSIHPGAYANPELLQNTPAQGVLGAVFGKWVLMPKPDGMDYPVKSHGESRREGTITYPLTDINLTPYWDTQGKEYLAVGGGYIYVGSYPTLECKEAIEITNKENHRALRQILPDQYDQAKRDGTLISSDAICFRSFTYDDQPLQASIRTNTGGLLTIDAGWNTGTATAAPYIAKEVRKKLS